MLSYKEWVIFERTTLFLQTQRCKFSLVFFVFCFFSCIFVNEIHIGSDIYQQDMPCRFQEVESSVRAFIGKICRVISKKSNHRFGHLSARYAVPFPRSRIIGLGIYRQDMPYHFREVEPSSFSRDSNAKGKFPRCKNEFLKKKILFRNGSRVDAFLDT